jgi:hypothetical protein
MIRDSSQAEIQTGTSFLTSGANKEIISDAAFPQEKPHLAELDRSAWK